MLRVSSLQNQEIIPSKNHLYLKISKKEGINLSPDE